MLKHIILRNHRTGLKLSSTTCTGNRDMWRIAILTLADCSEDQSVEIVEKDSPTVIWNRETYPSFFEEGAKDRMLCLMGIKT